MRLRAGLAVTLVLLGGCTPKTHPTTTGRPSPAARTTFVSERDNFGGRFGRSYVAVTDVTSGRVVKLLVRLPYRKQTYLGSAITRAGTIWLSFGSGPLCSSGVAGCGPRPHTCSSEVLTIAPDGARRTLLRGGNDLARSAVEPSPDGHRVAFLEGSCARSYFNMHVRVLDLRTKRSFTIGASLPPCHSLSDPTWTADGSHLIVAYGEATGDPGPDPGAGICTEPKPSGVAVVPATHPQPGISGATARSDAGCTIEDAVATADGLAAFEECGKHFLDGPAVLVRYTSDVRALSRTTIDRCVNGPEMKADASGRRLLIATYGFCNGEDPRTKVFTVDGATVKQLHFSDPPLYPNEGELQVSGIAW